MLGNGGRLMYGVNEIFATIQGEAKFTGTPSVFVRLQGCDVGCAFCDTKHTWTQAKEFEVPADQMLRKVGKDSEKFARMTATEIIDQAIAIRRGARHLVITGGEPAIYDLDALLFTARISGMMVQLETSGTTPLQLGEEFRCSPGSRCWVTVSPKVDMPGGLPVLDEVLMRADEIKHPCATQKHLDQLLALRPKLAPGTPIWLQPLSQSPAATERCIAWCQEHGFNLSLQTHKFAGIR